MDKFYTLENEQIPQQLLQIPKPPKKLYIKGKIPEENTLFLCIVGAREYSNYGEEVCKKLINGLKGHNICIVSGLALGIDGIAHRAALDNGLKTIAFPGSGLNKNVLYPASHARLAEEIVYAGGAIISEFEMDTKAAAWNFPMRNRLMAGISKAVLVIEAELKSGTLITSKLATDYNREVGAVPGHIFSPLSIGPHTLIRNGAIPITDSNDILEMLGLERQDGIKQYENVTQQSLLQNLNLNKDENSIIEILKIKPLNSDELIIKSNIPARKINEIISVLEIQNIIEKRGELINLK